MITSSKFRCSNISFNVFWLLLTTGFNVFNLLFYRFSECLSTRVMWILHLFCFCFHRNPACVLQVFKEERLDRMQVIRLINLVADAGWLPQPLASTIEIIEIIDGADVADLLLLVWRCMHHAMAHGNKSWGGSTDPVVPQNGVSVEKAQVSSGQVICCFSFGSILRCAVNFFIVRFALPFSVLFSSLSISASSIGTC